VIRMQTAVWSVFLLGIASFGTMTGGGEAAESKRYVIEPSQANMEAISQALGVECAYCHPRSKADGTPDYEGPSARKEIAIYMKQHFVDSLRTQSGGYVGCVDCHQGAARIVPRDPEGVPKSDLAEHQPFDEITHRMRRIAEDLGVECDACHRMRDDGRLDAAAQTPEKVAAKYMMDHFPGTLQTHNRKKVTCRTCHQEQMTFLPGRQPQEISH